MNHGPPLMLSPFYYARVILYFRGSSNMVSFAVLTKKLNRKLPTEHCLQSKLGWLFLSPPYLRNHPALEGPYKNFSTIHYPSAPAFLAMVTARVLRDVLMISMPVFCPSFSWHSESKPGTHWSKAPRWCLCQQQLLKHSEHRGLFPSSSMSLLPAVFSRVTPSEVLPDVHFIFLYPGHW